MRSPSRALLSSNPEHCYRLASLYGDFVQREDWEDDRGILSAVWYRYGNTEYMFQLLKGEVIEASWKAVE